MGSVVSGCIETLFTQEREGEGELTEKKGNCVPSTFTWHT